MVTGRRRRRTDDDDPKQIHGNTRVEIGWTIVPFLILLAVAIPTVATLISIDRTPANAMKISVYGQQWWWSYQYDVNGDGDPDVVTANELVIPAGKPVTLEVQSRDVIHSFWIPALNGTRDAVPGRVQTLQIVADHPGVFQGQCKEFCGLSHANMRARAVAMTPSDFDQWLSDQQTGAADAGRRFAGRRRASTCSRPSARSATRSTPSTTSKGTPRWFPGYAPNLTHLMSRTVFASGAVPALRHGRRRQAGVQPQPARSVAPRSPGAVADGPGRRPGHAEPPAQRDRDRPTRRVPPDARPVPAGRHSPDFFAMRS